MFKVLRIFHKDLADIHHAAFWLALFSILSGILGLFRDRMLAGFFGASRALDIYYSAFRAPDFIYTLMLFLTSATAIIPIFLRKLNSNKAEAENFGGTVILFFSCAALAVSSVAFFLMPQISDFLFPGFSSEEIALSSALSRIMLLSPIFLGISNIFSGIIQSFKRFFAYALSPVFYNLGIIFGILFFFPVFGINGLAYGVVLGAFLHMIVQVPSFIGAEFNLRFKRISFSEIKNVIVYSIPRTIGLAVNQVLILVFTAFASTLALGSIAVFNLSQNLGYLPTTIIGLSYSVAAFPTLASFSLKKERLGFEEHFSSAFRHIIFWTIPFSALFLILRAQIVRVILGSGAFSWQDTRLTAASLFLLSLGIAFQSLFLLLVRAFYAEGEIKKPLIINIVSAVFGIGSMFWFSNMLSPDSAFGGAISSLLDISDIADIRVLALPLGILSSGIFNLFLLLWAFKIVFGWFPVKKSQKSILEIIFASFVGAGATYGGLNVFSLFFDLNTFGGIFLQGVCSGFLGISVIGAILYFLKNREFFEVVSSFRNVVFKTHISVPEPDKLP